MKLHGYFRSTANWRVRIAINHAAPDQVAGSDGSPFRPQP